MTKFKRGRKISDWKSNRPAADAGKLRIIGGRFRGRQITYSGDSITRPMKDNIREALFNLIGGWVKEKAVFDLFAGTGAMGLEALSRGADKAFFIERHFPSAKIIRENIQCLGELSATVESADSFFWMRQFRKEPDVWPAIPWVVFFCPPYAFFEDRCDEMLEMINFFYQNAPKESVLVVESDQRFDAKQLPESEKWRHRQYAPAQLSIIRPELEPVSEDSR